MKLIPGPVTDRFVNTVISFNTIMHSFGSSVQNVWHMSHHIVRFLKFKKFKLRARVINNLVINIKA